MVRFEAPIVVRNPGGDARAGNEHLADVVPALPPQADLEGGALLPAGRIDEADIGAGLGEGGGWESQQE
jgi:hypothetical protein